MSNLFVIADDFGLHPDINRGIVDALAAGAMSGISVSPVGSAPDWDRLRNAQSAGVHVGVHLTLVGEPWVTTGIILTDWLALVGCLTTRGHPFFRQVESEAIRQIEVCREHDLHLQHLDSHQHVHLLPGLWPLFCRLAEQYHIPRIRVPVAPGWRLIRRSPTGIMLQFLGIRRRTEHTLPCIGLAHSGHYTLSLLEKELELCGGADLELIMHPGVTTPAVSGRYASWHYDWSRERDLLTHASFRNAIERHGYRLANQPA